MEFSTFISFMETPAAQSNSEEATGFAAARVLLVIIPIALILLAGVIILQIFLSKRENKWSGLILPMIFLIISLVAAFGMVAFQTNTSTSLYDQDGNVIETTIEKQPVEGAVPAMVFVLLFGNIPTVILLAIYFGCRERLKKNSEINKMNIQDLE